MNPLHFSGRYEIFFVNSKTNLPLSLVDKKKLAPQYNAIAKKRGWETGVPIIYRDKFILLTDKPERGQSSSLLAAKSYLNQLRQLIEKYPQAFRSLDQQGRPQNERPREYLQEKRELQALYAKDLKLVTRTL